jgi:deoxyribose-phosphate aldolase
MTARPDSLARRIQHTLVQPDATAADVERILGECLEHGFDGAMLQPCWIPLARERLAGSEVKLCTAFAYPMGGATTWTKIAEMRDLVALGADEIDWMPNLGFLRGGLTDAYAREVREVTAAADGRVTKVMLEMGVLTPDEVARAVEVAENAGATYVKNSSGFGKGGAATAEGISLLRSLVQRCRVKASGGIRTAGQARTLLEAGADLLGTSSGVAIVTGTTAGGEY